MKTETTKNFIEDKTSRINLQLFARGTPEGDDPNNGNTEDPPSPEGADPDNQQQQTPSNTQTDVKIDLNSPEVQEYVSQAVSKARQQEKDKLYPTIEQQKATIESLEKRIEELEKAQQSNQQSGQQEPEKDPANSGGEGSAGVSQTNNQQVNITENPEFKTLLETVNTLTEKVTQVAEKLTKTEEELSKEKVEAYRTSKLANSNLPPQFHNLVPTTSIEDIDKVIDNLVEGLKQVAPQQVEAPNQTPAVKLPGAPADASIHTSELSPADIYNMTNEQYAEFRKNNPYVFGTSQRMGRGLSSGGFRRQ